MVPGTLPRVIHGGDDVPASWCPRSRQNTSESDKESKDRARRRKGGGGGLKAIERKKLIDKSK